MAAPTTGLTYVKMVPVAFATGWWADGGGTTISGSALVSEAPRGKILQPHMSFETMEVRG